LSTRRRGRRSGVPLVRTPRTLPKVLDPGEVNALLGALRRWRDRAMVEAMVLGGLRRCEVLGLRLEDLRSVERRVFIAEGKGGHQRLVPISGRFFASVARYLDGERPPEATTDRVFVVLKGPPGVDRCRWTGSMRSCGPPGPERVWRTPPAMSCATPA
jgi:site-specific recombinase XerD